MSASVRLYILLVTIAAVAATGLVSIYGVSLSPTEFSDSLRAALCLGAIALITQLLSFSQTSVSRSSVAFVPFLATAALVPHWLAVASVFLTTLVIQFMRNWWSATTLFNVAQQCLSVSLAVLVYLAIGGTLLTPDALFPYLSVVALFVISYAINSVLVSGIVALRNRRRFLDVWSSTTRVSLPYDLLACPMIICLAWVYVNTGVVGAFAFSIPLLGLRQLYKTNADLEKTNQDLLEMMVAAIEARDPYTSGHSRRVARNAKIIAQMLGLRPAETSRIEIAALLHDVGKIHEEYAPILRKPGKLTDEERRIMQTHASRSAELIAKVSQLHDIVDAVRHHHENWDGRGYPSGLAGEQIPLGSRIIMLADTIDSMTSDRPYRKAMSECVVREELLKYRGRQFDPVICDVLLRHPRYHELFESYWEYPSFREPATQEQGRRPTSKLAEPVQERGPEGVPAGTF